VRKGTNLSINMKYRDIMSIKGTLWSEIVKDALTYSIMLNIIGILEIL